MQSSAIVAQHDNRQPRAIDDRYRDLGGEPGPMSCADPLKNLRSIGLRRERPCERHAAEEGDEFALSHV
jgi:hypothetical protein